MYQVIDKNSFPKKKQYEWFSKFANPCYGFDVKMDVTEVVKFSKRTNTSFFINVLYLITIGCSSVEEMRLRVVGEEIRLYDSINPTFTVMTDNGVFENAGFQMEKDYPAFYQKAKEVIEAVKHHRMLRENYNDAGDYDDYYMTCIPWLSYEGMTHPLPDNNPESSSCPRICWNRYHEENGKIVMLLNITVSHALVDGYPLSRAFTAIQNNFDNAENLLK